MGINLISIITLVIIILSGCSRNRAIEHYIADLKEIEISDLVSSDTQLLTMIQNSKERDFLICSMDDDDDDECIRSFALRQQLDSLIIWSDSTKDFVSWVNVNHENLTSMELTAMYIYLESFHVNIVYMDRLLRYSLLKDSTNLLSVFFLAELRARHHLISDSQFLLNYYLELSSNGIIQEAFETFDNHGSDTSRFESLTDLCLTDVTLN